MLPGSGTRNPRCAVLPWPSGGSMQCHRRLSSLLRKADPTWMKTGRPTKSSSMPSPAASAAATSGSAEAAETMRHRCRSEVRPNGASCSVLRSLLQLGALRKAAAAGGNGESKGRAQGSRCECGRAGQLCQAGARRRPRLLDGPHCAEGASTQRSLARCSGTLVPNRLPLPLLSRQRCRAAQPPMQNQGPSPAAAPSLSRT